MRKLLGIDQGTTQTTAVVIRETGELLGRHSVQVSPRFPRPGWVEQDPADVLRSVIQACAPLLVEHRVDAVGLDHQGETFLLWDRVTGEPVTPAIVWQDTRAAALCETLNLRVDSHWIRSKTGLMMDSYFSAPKLKWIFDQHPRLLRRAHEGELLFGTMDTWVAWSLSKERLHVTDPSTASRTLLFDIHQGQWDDELLEIFGVPRRILPQVRPSAGLKGTLDLAAGPGPGERVTVPLHAMIVDQQAALIGHGCLRPGEMKCSFGTGTFLLMNLGEAPRLSNHGLLTTIAWQVGGRTTYALDGGIFVTGAAVQWLRDNLGLIPDVAASSDAARRSADPEVVVVPALQGLASPHWASSGDDIVRATLDGIACRTHEIVTAMAQDAGRRPPHLNIDGGPSANAYLMQAIADLANLEVRVSLAVEASAIGAADLAAVSALGVTLEQIAARPRPQTVYRPSMNPERRAQVLARWNRALQAVKTYHAPTDNP